MAEVSRYATGCFCFKMHSTNRGQRMEAQLDLLTVIAVCWELGERERESFVY